MRFRGSRVGHRSTVSCNAVLRREAPTASSVQWETEGEDSMDSGGIEADEEEENSDDEEDEETDSDSDPDSDDEFYNLGSEEEYRDEDVLSDGVFGAL